MLERKFDLTYSQEKIWDKDLFIFVNHKVATFCWALLRKKTEIYDVITFDSHRDYHGGVILQQGSTDEMLHLPAEKRCFSSKYYQYPGFPHFKTSHEFIDWDPLDNEQNNDKFGKERKYFLPNNDNFIDVAFMKGIIGNVYCYYFETRNDTHSGKCDDIFGIDHFFEMTNIKNFKLSKFRRKFILDIDLDFFVARNYESGYPTPLIIPEPDLETYISLIKSIVKQKNCVGITLALEPECCGSEENCIELCKYFSKAFQKDILSLSKERLIKYNKLS